MVLPTTQSFRHTNMKMSTVNQHLTEYDQVAQTEANEVVDCPSCGGDWYMDIEPDTGVPYTCFACCNGSLVWRKHQAEAYTQI